MKKRWPRALWKTKLDHLHKVHLAMQSPVDGCSSSRDLATSDRAHIDENVANNGQQTDNKRVIIGDASRTPLQVQIAGRYGQSRQTKRTIKYVPLADKVVAIYRVHDGQSKASVARDIGVAESTLRGWCKSEHKIRSEFNNVNSEIISRHYRVNTGNNQRDANTTDAISREVFTAWVAQHMMNALRMSGHNFGDISNILKDLMGWYWQWVNWVKLPVECQCTLGNMLTFLDIILNNNSGNTINDDTRENRARS